MFLVAHRTPTTAAGCAALARAGAGMFEVDVQLRAERLVVSHYLPLRRTGGWIEHDNARFRIRSGPPYDPTLAEVLTRVPDDCGILLDPKATGATARAELIDALRDALPDRERFRVSTSDVGDLDAYRTAGFRTWRTIKNPGQLAALLADGPLPDVGVSARHTVLDARSVERLHGVTDIVVAWTVNDRTRARQLRDLGVDGLTTDRVPSMAALTRAPQ